MLYNSERSLIQHEGRDKLMYQTVMDDVAYLFVEQYEKIHGFLSDSYNKREGALIRQTAD